MLKYLERGGIIADGSKIIFPLMDKYKSVVGFTKRWIDKPEDCNDKYNNGTNTSIFNKSSYFYGSHNIKIDVDEIRITEGPMDVIMASKYGAKNIVAILGAALTDEHVALIKKMNKIPVFILDGDSTGIEKTKTAVDKLAAQNIYCKILTIPDKMDLCDLALKERYNIEDYISAHAITYGQYKVAPILAEYESKLLELRIKKFGEILRVLEHVPNKVERKILESTISKTMDMPF